MWAAAVGFAAAIASFGTGCTHDPHEDVVFVCNAFCDCAAPLGGPNQSCEADCTGAIATLPDDCLECVEKSAVCSETVNCLRTCLGGP